MKRTVETVMRILRHEDDVWVVWRVSSVNNPLKFHHVSPVQNLRMWLWLHWATRDVVTSHKLFWFQFNSPRSHSHEPGPWLLFEITLRKYLKWRSNLHQSCSWWWCWRVCRVCVSAWAPLLSHCWLCLVVWYEQMILTNHSSVFQHLILCWPIKDKYEVRCGQIYPPDPCFLSLQCLIWDMIMITGQTNLVLSYHNIIIEQRSKSYFMWI